MSYPQPGKRLYFISVYTFSLAFSLGYISEVSNITTYPKPFGLKIFFKVVLVLCSVGFCSTSVAAAAIKTCVTQ